MSSAGRLVADLARPQLLRRLAETGVLDPRVLLAAAATLPWLVGRGPCLGLMSQIHGLARPRRIAVVDRDGPLSWSELDARVNRLAGGLGALGVAGKVALLLRNGRHFVEAMLAAQKIGLVAAPLNTWGKRPELEGILTRERPEALVYDTRHAAELDGAVPDGVQLVHVGPDADRLDGSVGYERLLERGSTWPPSPVTARPGVSRVLIHTSGTTGTPKAASRSTGMAGGAALLGVLDAVPFRHDDVLYLPNPLFHALGVFTFAVGMVSGATMVLPDRFDPQQAWGDLGQHRITAACFVPVMLRRMLDARQASSVDSSPLRILLVSGAAVPPELRRRVGQCFGPVLYDLYGSTEAGWIAIATPESIAEAPESVGRPIAGVEVVLLGDRDEVVTEGEGEIHVRSMVTFEGYASGERAEQRDGYLATGDVGTFDEAGRLYVVGRADDMIVVGGENVYPDEVDEVIEAVDGVAEGAVVGVDDDEMGQVLEAFFVGEVEPTTVEQACREQLPSYKVPRRFHRVEELPRTSTGKVIRAELADEVKEAR